MPYLAIGEATWPELEAAVRRGYVTALVPLGATEQHGPHLPCRTDTLRAGAIARRVAHGLGEPVLLAPVLPVGASDEHRGFPGLLGMSTETLTTVLVDLAERLRTWGVERLILLSAHGGNVGAVRAAAERIRGELPPLTVAVPYGADGRLDAARQEGVSRARMGLHAGEAETSEILAIDGAAVRHDRLERGLVDDPAALLDRMRSEPLIALSPSGVIGDPRRSDAERGRRYLEGQARAVIAQLRRPETWGGAAPGPA